MDRDFVQKEHGGRTWFSCNWISKFPVLL